LSVALSRLVAGDGDGDVDDDGDGSCCGANGCADGVYMCHIVLMRDSGMAAAVALLFLVLEEGTCSAAACYRFFLRITCVIVHT
jgi:hypothetical protein